MAHGMRMVQTQSQQQKLVMTLQMQQSIQLLQMNTLELEQHISNELEENPFLTTAEDDGDDYSVADSDDLDAPVVPDTPIDPKTVTTVEEPVVEAKKPDDPNNPESFEDVDVNWDDCFDPFESSAKYRGIVDSTEDERQDFTEYTALSESLYDHLNWQLRVSGLEGENYKIGYYLINTLDENGYLSISVEEIAEDLKISLDKVEEVLEICQDFEPAGVLARNQEECLRLQLEEMEVRDTLVYKILDEDFTDLQKGKLKELARKHQVDLKRIQDVKGYIRRCDPKPGRSITKDQTRYITPDVYVKQIEENENNGLGARYMYFLNEGDVGMLHVDAFYKELFSNGAVHTKEDKVFAKDKYSQAVWLIRNIEKRKSTILRVTEAIMEYQRDFLDKGIEFLKPLTLKDIAQVVGMHESTVARVTSSKYVETPRGVFELKFFFSSHLETDGGEATSSRSVKNIIEEIISKEDEKKPFSDLKITNMLNDRGIQIARRTVAKYREQLKILPAKLRKVR